MTNDDRSTAQLDDDLRQLLRDRADAVTPRPQVMAEIALRDSARRKQRREIRLVGAGLATAAVVVAALLVGPLALDRSDRSLPADPRPTRDVPLREPAAGEIAATIDLPGYDASAAFVAFGEVFVRLRSPVPTIVKVDPGTNAVAGSLELPKDVALVEGLDPVVAAGSLWWPAERAIYRIDPQSMTVTGTIPVDIRQAAVASDGQRVWAVDGDGVAEVDPATNALSGRTSVGGPPMALAFAGGSLWAAVGTTIVQLEPEAGEVVGRTTVPGDLDVLTMLPVDNSLWVGVNDLDRLVRITADGGLGASVTMPAGSATFDEFDPQLSSSSDGRTLWGMTAGKELVAVDLATADVVDRIIVNNGPYHSQVAVLGDTVWIPRRGTSTVIAFRWQDR